jgi:hypothetical protein
MCKDIPLDTERGGFYLNDGFEDANDWCSDKVASEGHCFRGTFPTKSDDDCKCLDHKCHEKNTKHEL